MKTQSQKTPSRTARRPAAKSAGKRGAKFPAGKAGAKPKPARASASGRSGKAAAGAKPARRAKPAARRPSGRRPTVRLATSKRPTGQRDSAARWLDFVEEHGVVLASARGPVPCIAEAVAGQPIVGSWWAHPKGKAIFAALSELDDSDDVRCFKLIDGKITFVHRRVWPALACLVANGAISVERAASIQQEHMPTGEHRNLVTPFPDWVPDDVARAAAALTVAAARAELGAWI